MRSCPAFFPFFLLLTSVTGPASARSPADLTAASAVLIEAIAGSRAAIGAGVVIAAGPDWIRVVTAKHVADYGEPTVELGGRLVPARVLREIPGRDLAVLQVTTDWPLFARLQPAVLADPCCAGASLFVWGDDGLQPRVEEAVLNELDPSLPDGPARGRFTIACSSCAPGDSGAGVFSADGLLIGILVGRWHSSDGTTVAMVAEPVGDLR